MAITYTYTDAASTVIKEVDDSTTPDTIRYIPKVVGNRDYDALVAASTSITAYTAVYPGYDTVTNARTTRTLEAEAALHAFLESENLLFKTRRAEYGGGYSLSSADTTKIQDAYGRYVVFLGALAGSTNIENIRTSTIDYVADTHNVA